MFAVQIKTYLCLFFFFKEVYINSFLVGHSVETFSLILVMHIHDIFHCSGTKYNLTLLLTFSFEIHQT